MVLVVALIVFGPEKLPGMARTVGRTMNQLRRMADDVKSEFQSGLDDIESDATAEPVADVEPDQPVADEAEPVAGKTSED